jgi:hypothetical protein
MKRHYLQILITVFGFAGLGMTTKAQEGDKIQFTVSHEFVVEGKTLPAGKYNVRRISANNNRILVVSSFERGMSVSVLATDIENNRTRKANVSFRRVGDEYVLSQIGTSDNLIAIPSTHPEFLAAAPASHGATSQGGTSNGSR